MTVTNHLEIIKRLCDHDHDTYLVGGGIRDMLSGGEPKDFDIVTAATPEMIMELFKDCNVMTIGKSIGVVLVDGYEVATFRHDRHHGIGDKNCTVYFADSIQEDLSRRDFTVNAMAYCELTGEIVDEHNGQSDLNRRIILFVGDPQERILEDPNRIIRACRFLAKLQGEFDLGTRLALEKNARLVRDEVAPERTRLEILKAIELEQPSLFFSALHSIDVLQYIFPAMDSCVDHPHGKHHIEDVFVHLMLAGVSEWSGIDELHEIACFIEEYPGIGGALLSQFCDNLEEAKQAIEVNYYGCYESLADYAEELTTSTSEVPEHLSYYIDYDRMGRDMEMGGDIITVETEHNEVHVFGNC